MPFPSPVVYPDSTTEFSTRSVPSFRIPDALPDWLTGATTQEFRILAVLDAVTSIPFPEPPDPGSIIESTKVRELATKTPDTTGCRRSIRNLNRTPIHPSHTPNGQGIRDHVIRTPESEISSRHIRPRGDNHSEAVGPL